MKRRILIIIIVLIFNFFLFKGINYTNKFIAERDLVINLLEHPKEEVPVDTVKPIIIDEYNGEKKDAIVSKINKYLAKTELKDIGNGTFVSAVTNDVNPYMLAAMVLVNTECNNECTVIMKSCNNVSYLRGEPGCFGGSYKKYNSIDDSIADLASYVGTNYVKNNLKTPYDIYKKYGKNIAWAYKVDKVMGLMKKG